MASYTTYNFRFALGCVLTIGSIWALCYFLPKELYTDWTYTEWRIKLDALENPEHTRALHVVAIGDSTAVASYSGEQLGDSFYNFALSGGTFLEAYYLLEKLSKVARLDTVVITLVPDYLNEGSPFFWQRSIGFNLLGDDFVDMILDAAGPEDIAYFGVGSRLGFGLRRLSFAAGSPKEYLIPVLSGLAARRWTTAPEFREKIVRQRGRMSFGAAKCWNEPSRLAKDEEFRISPIQEAFLDRLVRLSKAGGFKLYFFPPAMNIASQSAPSGYVDSFSNFMQAKGLALVEQQYIDNCYFGDGVHPNLAGAEYLSNFLRDFLDEEGLPERAD